LYFAVGGHGFPTFPYKIVDLARNLDENQPYWPTLAGYEKIVEHFGKNFDWSVVICCSYGYQDIYDFITSSATI
jgi:hypothetical protein